MKKRPAIGLTVAVLVVSVVLGIASLPDDVLIDSSAIENSQTIPTDSPIVSTVEESQEFIANAVEQKKIDTAKAELDALKQEMDKLKNEIVELKTDSQVPDEPTKTPEVTDMPPASDPQVKSGGKVIKVNIKDGVGSKSR